MRKLKRIIVLTLVLALVASCLASCGIGKNPDKLIEKAEQALNEESYSMEMRIKYESDYDEMRDAIGKFSNPSINVKVNEDKFSADMTLKHGSEQNYLRYTYVDGVLYTEWQEGEVTVKENVEYSKDDREALKATLGEGASIGPEDFEEITSEGLGKVSLLTCKKIKKEALFALIDSLKAEFDAASIEADVAIKDATLQINVEDGKYTIAILTCEYYITTELDTYSIIMTHSTKFTYGDVEVTAPSFD